MKKSALLLIPVVAALMTVSVFAAEDFKGEPPTAEFNAGALAGLGVIDSSGGFALMGTFSKKIIHRGFVADINNQVFLEAQAGPVFFSGSTAFAYSAHLRWDFPKDDLLTLYAIGGLSGNITDEKFGSQWELFPRFGVGVMYKIAPILSLRGEISHEFIVTGVSFPF